MIFKKKEMFCSGFWYFLMTWGNMFLLFWLISSLMLKMLQSSISSLNMNTKFCDDLDSSSNEVQYTVVQRPCFFIGPGDLISNLRGHPRPKRRLETFLLTCDFCVFFFTWFEVSNYQDYQTESIFTQVNFFYTKSVSTETFLINCIVLKKFLFSILSFLWTRKREIQILLALNCTKLHAIFYSALSAKQPDFIDGAVK